MSHQSLQKTIEIKKDLPDLINEIKDILNKKNADSNYVLVNLYDYQFGFRNSNQGFKLLDTQVGFQTTGYDSCLYPAAKGMKSLLRVLADTISNGSLPEKLIQVMLGKTLKKVKNVSIAKEPESVLVLLPALPIEISEDAFKEITKRFSANYHFKPIPWAEWFPEQEAIQLDFDQDLFACQIKIKNDHYQIFKFGTHKAELMNIRSYESKAEGIKENDKKRQTNKELQSLKEHTIIPPSLFSTDRSTLLKKLPCSFIHEFFIRRTSNQEIGSHASIDRYFSEHRCGSADQIYFYLRGERDLSKISLGDLAGIYDYLQSNDNYRILPVPNLDTQQIDVQTLLDERINWRSIEELPGEFWKYEWNLKRNAQRPLQSSDSDFAKLVFDILSYSEDKPTEDLADDLLYELKQDGRTDQTPNVLFTAQLFVKLMDLPFATFRIPHTRVSSEHPIVQKVTKVTGSVPQKSNSLNKPNPISSGTKPASLSITTVPSRGAIRPKKKKRAGGISVKQRKFLYSEVESQTWLSEKLKIKIILSGIYTVGDIWLQKKKLRLTQSEINSLSRLFSSYGLNFKINP